MPTLYGSVERLLKRIPANFDADALDATEMVAILDTSSRQIDADLGSKFITFPDIEGTPATPRQIEDLCLDLSVIGCLKVVIPSSENTDFEDEITRRQKDYDRTVSSYLAGKAVLLPQIATQALTDWGTGGAYSWLANECRIGESLAPDGEVPTIIETSLQVTAPSNLIHYWLGNDMKVRYDGRFRAWLVVDMSQQLRTAGASVSFKWRCDRYTDIPDPGETRSGDLQFT